MKTILIDIDGVVADMHPEWMRMYNADYNDTLKSSDVIRWGTHEFVKPECGKKIYEYLWNETLYDNVKPIDGALTTINWLRELGHKTIFVTSGIQPAKIKWLSSHGFLRGEYWQSDKDVVIASDKSLIKGDFLIDDNIENCEHFNGIHVLFAQPWNSECGLLERVKGWTEAAIYLAKRLDV